MAAADAPLIPLYGFVEGDTIGLLVLATPEESIAGLATRLQQAARLRVAPKVVARVLHAGNELNPRLSVQQAGLQALDRFDVVEGAS